MGFRGLVQHGHPLCGNSAIPRPVGASSTGCIRGRTSIYLYTFIFTTAALGNPVITGDLSEVSTVSSALSLCLPYLPNKGPLLTKEKKITKAKSPPNPVICSHKTKQQKRLC